MKYNIPILNPEHAAFCLREAERRYRGRLVRHRDGMLTVKDTEGFEHTDPVLRALSNEYRRGRITI